MFCSNCGKTIKADASVCPKCGAMLGESRFEGNGYTSVQARFLPGEQPKEEARYTPYTRTTYTSMDSQNDDDVYARTTYRPVLTDDDNESGSDKEKAAHREDGEAAEDGMDSLDGDAADEIDPITGRPIKPPALEGINPEVEAYMQRIKARKNKPKLSLKARDKKAGKPDEDEEQSEEAAAGGQLDLTNAEGAENADEDQEEEAPRRGRVGVGRVIGMAAGALAIVLLLVAGFIYVSSQMAPKSNIPGVSKSLYDAGIPLVKSYVSDDYRWQVARMFEQDVQNDTQSAEQKLAEDKGAIEKLLPEKKLENDQLFVDALVGIQQAIGNAIAMDASVMITQASGTTGGLEKFSEEEWASVTNLLQRIENATDARELQGIVQDSKASTTTLPSTAPTEQPSPTPPVYKTLTKGDKNLTAIKRLQTRLLELGYLSGKVDGDFGTATQTAVKLFQQTIGMNADGVATPEVQQALFAEDAPTRAPGTTDTGPTEATPTPNPDETPVPVDPAQ